jgi:hypothetical protein
VPIRGPGPDLEIGALSAVRRPWYATFFTRIEVGLPRRDPIDHERTTRRHAGESVNNGVNAPGVAGVAVAVVALIGGLFALATGHVAAGSIAVFLAALLAATGAGWLIDAHRQVRKAELQQWEATHFDGPAPPPSS